MKKDLPLYFSVALIFFGLIFSSQLLFQGQRKNQGLDLKSYQSQMIPLYQERGKVMSQLLNSQNIENHQVTGILLHAPTWAPKNKQEALEIEELNVYLDTAFSQNIVQLTNDSENKLLQKQLGQIQSLDSRLQSARKIFLAQ